MFTSLDKALAAIVMGLLYALNNLFGINIGIDPALIDGIIVALTPFIVYLIPNKKPAVT